MTIQQALSSLNTYPIPVSTIEKICVDRELTIDAAYSKTIGVSELFELATADVYKYLSIAPDLKEQEVSITNTDRDNFKNLANSIYGKYDDPAFDGIRYGFIGENYNG